MVRPVSRPLPLNTLLLGHKCAKQYQQSQSASESGASTNATGDGSKTASGSDNAEAKLMMQIMKLAHAYGIGQEGGAAATSSLLVTA